MTQLTDNLYALEIPSKARNFGFSQGGYFGWGSNGKTTVTTLHIDINSIIGTVTKDNIYFDCGELINPDKINLSKRVLESAFRSLLTSKGLTEYYKLVIIKKV